MIYGIRARQTIDAGYQTEQSQKYAAPALLSGAPSDQCQHKQDDCRNHNQKKAGNACQIATGHSDFYCIVLPGIHILKHHLSVLFRLIPKHRSYHKNNNKKKDNSCKFSQIFHHLTYFPRIFVAFSFNGLHCRTFLSNKKSVPENQLIPGYTLSYFIKLPVSITERSPASQELPAPHREVCHNLPSSQQSPSLRLHGSASRS